MAIKDGRCPNCGSILHLDPAAESGHCIFCDAVFANSMAFEIAANPKGVVFPNEPQPKYEGPSLDAKPAFTALSPEQRLKLNQQTVKRTREVSPAYVVKEPVKVPGVKLPLKTKLRVFGALAGILIIVAAIMIPSVIGRDSVRSQLLSSMATIVPFSVDVEKGVSISRNDNSSLLIATDQTVTQTDMITAFKAYCQKRAQILNLDINNFNSVYGHITVKIVTPTGGWLIDRPNDQAALDSGAAVEQLNP